MEIDFEVTTTTHRTGSGEPIRTSNTEYRLIRSTSDTLSWRNMVSRSNDKSDSSRLTPQGDRPIRTHRMRLIFEHLPPELREVFFTDGDQSPEFHRV